MILGNYTKVTLNVEGKIEHVMVEKGINVRFLNCDNTNVQDCKETSLFTLSNGKIAKGDWREEGIFYQTETKPIKMTKEQFQIFKNMADNVKENKDNVILSKSDIDKANYLYRNGRYTKDITANLPIDYKPSMDAQDLYERYDYLELSTRIHNHNSTQEMSFAYGTMYNETYDKAMLDSKNGRVKQNYHGDCLQLEYIDKNNKVQKLEY